METRRSSGLHGKKDGTLLHLITLQNTWHFPLTQVIILMLATGSDSSVQIQTKPTINEKSNKSFHKFSVCFKLCLKRIPAPPNLKSACQLTDSFTDSWLEFVQRCCSVYFKIQAIWLPKYEMHLRIKFYSVLWGHLLLKIKNSPAFIMTEVLLFNS